MKPGFALDLSNDGLRLLARRTAGWVELGRADFADPDLETKLAALRGKAETLAPGRVATKLVLPASQILYTVIDAPGPDRATRRAQIAAALDGRTPYAVKDLVFDWSRIGPEVHAAVVARETLEEAESFAESHGFNPVAFVATPEPGQFAGEPFFGEASAAATHLPTGDRLDRDQDPVHVIDATDEDDTDGDPPLSVVQAEAAPEAEALPPDATEDIERAKDPSVTASGVVGVREVSEGVSFATEPDEDAPDEEHAEAPAADPAHELETTVAETEVVATEESSADAADTVSKPDGTETPEESPAPETSAMADADDTEPAPPLAASAEPNITAALPPDDDDAPEPAEETASPHPAAKSKDEEPVSVQPDALAATLAPGTTLEGLDAPFIAIDDLDELEDAPVPARPSAPAFTTHRPEGPAVEVTSDTSKHESRLTLALAKAAPHHADKTEPELSVHDIVPADQGVTAPVLPVPRRARDNELDESSRQKPSALAARGVQAPLPEARHGTQAQRGTPGGPVQTMPAAPQSAAPASAAPAPSVSSPSVFGATRGSPEDRPSLLTRGRVLATILALLLLAVALWWMLLAGPAEEETVDLAPASDPPAALPGAAPEPEAPEVAVSDTTATAIQPEAGTEPAPPTDESAATQPGAVADSNSETEAEVPTVAPPSAETLWDDAPQSATGEPGPDAPGAPTIASAAPVTERPDPLVRPAAPADVTDAALRPQPLPPPFGTTFEFLPDGSIRPTEDGVVTPGGFTLIAGRPPVAPTLRPGSAAEPAALPAQEPALEPEPDPATSELDTTAPAAAAPEVQGAAPLPDPVDPAHAAKQPRARPAVVVARAAEMAAEAEAARKAEAEAQRALEEAIASATARAVASSQRPKSRPSGLARAVDDAVATAVAESVAASAATAVQPAPEPAPAPAPEPTPQAEIDEPEPVAPTPNIPTTATVARQATIKNAINLRDVSLIGVFGSSANRRALVRLPSGRMIKVKVGDRLDGGQVAAIGDSELSYVKRGRTVVLKILKRG
ncbi:hypothetical protein [Albidovulum aquaemixtae]|nr:hypothetical protein [Defluviimonas aquaemixtae]